MQRRRPCRGTPARRAPRAPRTRPARGSGRSANGSCRSRRRREHVGAGWSRRNRSQFGAGSADESRRLGWRRDPLLLFSPPTSPRSSGDRAPPSGGGCAGSNPAGGARFYRAPRSARQRARSSADRPGAQVRILPGALVQLSRIATVRSDRLSRSADARFEPCRGRSIAGEAACGHSIHTQPGLTRARRIMSERATALKSLCFRGTTETRRRLHYHCTSRCVTESKDSLLIAILRHLGGRLTCTVQHSPDLVAATAAALMLAPSFLPHRAPAPMHAAKATPTTTSSARVGYASRVIGGDVPAGSGQTAFSVIGCTNQAGIDHTQHQGRRRPRRGMRLSNVKTRTWTDQARRHGLVVQPAHIEKVVLADTALGSLYLDGRRLDLSRLAQRRAASTPRPQRRRPTSCSTRSSAAADHVRSRCPARRSRFPASPRSRSATAPRPSEPPWSTAPRWTPSRCMSSRPSTTVYLAHSAATIRAGAPTALYRGSAFGAQGRRAEGVVTSRRVPQRHHAVPRNRRRTRTDAASSKSTLRPACAPRSCARPRGPATTRGAVLRHQHRQGGSESLSATGLVVTAIHARAHVHKAGTALRQEHNGHDARRDHLQRRRAWSSPRPACSRFPGVAKIESNIVHQTRTSIAVTALRVTLLDGRLATIDIGYAEGRGLTSRRGRLAPPDPRPPVEAPAASTGGSIMSGPLRSGRGRLLRQAHHREARAQARLPRVRRPAPADLRPRLAGRCPRAHPAACQARSTSPGLLPRPAGSIDASTLIDQVVVNGAVWISWPKKSSGVATDLDENIVREIGLAAGVVDVKVAAVDDTWSALKFVRRLRDR